MITYEMTWNLFVLVIRFDYLITDWLDGAQKGQNLNCLVFEWFLSHAIGKKLFTLLLDIEVTIASKLWHEVKEFTMVGSMAGIELRYLCASFFLFSSNNSVLFHKLSDFQWFLPYIQPKNFAYIRLLNKPYENEVTLRGQKPSLKCCWPLDF